MKKVSISKNSQYCLVGKINGLSNAVKRARAWLLKGKTEFSRNNRAITKRDIGIEARHHMLVYAFVRDIPYISLERKCRPENKPDPYRILQIVNSHLTSYEVKQNVCTLDHIKMWLNGEELPAEKKMSIKEKIDSLWGQNAV